MITIEGFSTRQKMLADIIWTLDTKDQVEAFINTLPEKQKREARVVCEMMILAFIDEVDTVDQEVVELLNTFKGV